MLENDINAAALAEQASGHGRDVGSFVFVSIGTGIGMGLVMDGQLVRGAHGVAGEIAYIPMTGGRGAGPERPSGGARWRRPRRRRGRPGRPRAGLRGPVSARRCSTAAAKGDERAAGVVADEALLVARLLCTVISLVDPELIVLGGGSARRPASPTR